MNIARRILWLGILILLGTAATFFYQGEGWRAMGVIGTTMVFASFLIPSRPKRRS